MDLRELPSLKIADYLSDISKAFMIAALGLSSLNFIDVIITIRYLLLASVTFILALKLYQHIKDVYDNN